MVTEVNNTGNSLTLIEKSGQFFVSTKNQKSKFLEKFQTEFMKTKFVILKRRPQ